MFFILLIGLLIGISLTVIAQSIISQQEISLSTMTRSKLKEIMINHKYEIIIVSFSHTMLYGGLVSKFGLTFELLIGCFFITMLYLIALIDFKTQDVYTVMTLFTAIIGSVLIIINGILAQEIPYDLVVGALTGFLSIGLIVWLTGGMGEGDIEIAALIGLFLGTKLVLLSLFLSFILGGIGGTFLLISGSSKKDEMAFGPYLVVAAIISLFFGNELLDLYIKTFIFS